MSLDIYLVRDYCDKCGRGDDEVYWRNITHNVSNMWREAGVYDSLYESHGQKASQHIDKLERGLELMLNHFEEYKRLDASNGWGKAEHAIAFLYFTLKAFREYPGAQIRVSK